MQNGQFSKGKIQKESGTEFPEAPAQNFGLKKDEFVAMTTSLKLGDEHLFERVVCHIL
ncbi:MAG: hypothetical protein IPO92_18105 [Saprospiraceae bacterium]|nr:hypothetical protein [Saprospiraceae bacterium]